MRPGNLEYFIKKANLIHGGKYNYDKVIANEPKTVKDKIIVTCPIHGDFETTFDTHVNKGSGCQKCSGTYKRTTEEFIQECKEANKGKNYDYSKVVYKSNKKDVIVICHELDMYGNEHGEFPVRAAHLLNGHGCPKCANRYISTKDWIYMAKKVHGDRYDYSLVEYKNNRTPVKIICPEHGVFEQNPDSHLRGSGCSKCNGGVRLSKEEFVKKANERHNFRYDYTKFVYVNAHTDGVITCPVHGDFEQSPDLHLRGAGCPRCKSSRLEGIIASKFSDNGIEYDMNVYLSGEMGKQSIDFFIPSKKLYIECQGEQHYLPTKFSSSMIDEDSISALEARKKLDAEKYDWCASNGFELIYFTDPSQFRNDKTFDVFGGFYSDKKVFVDPDDVIRYVSGVDSVDGAKKPLSLFKKDMLEMFSGVYFSNNRVRYKDFVIYFNGLQEQDKQKLNELKRTNERRGYKVIHIFEDEYMNRRDIVLSKLKHIMGNENEGSEKISGRECDVRLISNTDAEKFLEMNHIQGFVPSTVYIGAFYEGKLVACMSFLSEGTNEWNLTRFASLNGTICRGVGGKLFKWFIREYNPYEIRTFADRRWTLSSDDNLYTKLGFKLAGRSAPDYRYYKKGESKERLHKFNFRKQTLSKKYGFSMDMTETEMTRKLGYDRIWDCGLFKYVWTNKGGES